MDPGSCRTDSLIGLGNKAWQLLQSQKHESPLKSAPTLFNLLNFRLCYLIKTSHLSQEDDEVSKAVNRREMTWVLRHDFVCIFRWCAEIRPINGSCGVCILERQTAVTRMAIPVISRQHNDNTESAAVSLVSLPQAWKRWVNISCFLIHSQVGGQEMEFGYQKESRP